MATIGRPAKYNEMIKALDPDKLYSAGSIVREAVDKKIEPFNTELSDEEQRKTVTRVRHAHARRSANHYFPPEGDGFVRIQGQPLVPGWKGRRWMDTIVDPKGA